MPPSALRLTWRSFALEKQGHDVAEYEDAYAAAPEEGRFAVADGASESSFAGEWARLLVDSFVAEPVRRGGWETWLPPIRQRWLAAVKSEKLPWYAQQKLEEGAFATFVGIEIGTLQKDTGFSWRSVAVGDACLFQVRDGALVLSFPIERAIDFNTRPDLLNSSAKGNLPNRDQFLAGWARPGDRFFLATDALARWFLTEVEAERSPWEVLQNLTPPAFPDWVEHLRGTRDLRNDDVTLVSVEVGP